MTKKEAQDDKKDTEYNKRDIYEDSSLTLRMSEEDEEILEELSVNTILSE